MADAALLSLLLLLLIFSVSFALRQVLVLYSAGSRFPDIMFFFGTARKSAWESELQKRFFDSFLGMWCHVLCKPGGDPIGGDIFFCDKEMGDIMSGDLQWGGPNWG